MRNVLWLSLLLLSPLARAAEISTPTDAEVLEALIAHAGQMRVYGEDGKVMENEFQMPMFIARQLISTFDKVDDSDVGGLGIYLPAVRTKCRDVTAAGTKGARHYDCEYTFEMVEHKVNQHVLTPSNFKLGNKMVVTYSREEKAGAKLKLRAPRVVHSVIF